VKWDSSSANPTIAKVESHRRPNSGFSLRDGMVWGTTSDITVATSRPRRQYYNTKNKKRHWARMTGNEEVTTEKKNKHPDRKGPGRSERYRRYSVRTVASVLISDSDNFKEINWSGLALPSRGGEQAGSGY
jgi:hypothetical protein